MGRRSMPATANRPTIDLQARLPFLACGVVLAWALFTIYRADVFSSDEPMWALIRARGFGPGLAALAALAYLLASSARRDMVRRRYPNEPWMWQRTWDRRGARPEAKSGGANLGNAIAAVVLSSAALGIVLWIVLTDFIPGSDTLTWSLRVCAVAALASWTWLGVLAAPRSLHGPLFFHYDSFPFFLDQRLSGELEGLDAFDGLGEIGVAIVCTRVDTVYNELNPRVPTYKYTNLYKDGRLFNSADIVDRPRKSGRGSGFRKVLPVEFDIPRHAPTTDLDSASLKRWRLQVTAKRKGVDVDETFLLPVYAQSDSAEVTR